MHAALFDVTIIDAGSAEAGLRDQVVPAARQAPGFIAGYWLDHGGDKGKAFVVFESEQAAQAWVESRPAGPDPPPVRVDKIEVAPVVANA